VSPEWRRRDTPPCRLRPRVRLHIRMLGAEKLLRTDGSRAARPGSTISHRRNSVPGNPRHNLLAAPSPSPRAPRPTRHLGGNELETVLWRATSRLHELGDLRIDFRERCLTVPASLVDFLPRGAHAATLKPGSNHLCRCDACSSLTNCAGSTRRSNSHATGTAPLLLVLLAPPVLGEKRL